MGTETASELTFPGSGVCTDCVSICVMRILGCFMRRISVASNPIQTIDNDTAYLIVYYTFELHSTPREFHKIIFVLFPLGLVPDKPINLTVTNITSRSAEISWLDPKDQGRYGISRFWIKLKKENSQIISITTTVKVNAYEINNLTSYTTYEISVAAGNRYGFGEETITSLLTSEEGEW